MNRKNRSLLLWTLCGLALIGIFAAVSFARQPITIHARIAEDGGFLPASLKANVGEPLRLRLIADDVEHKFALGQSSLPPVLLKPGKPENITLTFDQPGRYTFYEAAPSSLNFWRMRGVIEVSGDVPIAPAEAPLYEQLGINLDEEHEAAADWELSRPPAAARGQAFASQIPAAYLSREYYVAHAPMQAFDDLRAESSLAALKEEEIWDVVALLWQKNSSTADISQGERLYQDNCAACHGKNGAGDGLFAAEMSALAEKNQPEHGIQPPTDFTHAEHLLEAQPAKLHGLILRGGMGTGMPMWGSIFTDQQIWDLVAYLYTFQFEYHP